MAVLTEEQTLADKRNVEYVAHACSGNGQYLRTMLVEDLFDTIEYLRTKLAAAEAREARVMVLVGKWGDHECRTCRCAACQVIVRHADELLAALGEKEPKP